MNRFTLVVVYTENSSDSVTETNIMSGNIIHRIYSKTSSVRENVHCTHICHIYENGLSDSPAATKAKKDDKKMIRYNTMAISFGSKF